MLVQSLLQQALALDADFSEKNDIFLWEVYRKKNTNFGILQVQRFLSLEGGLNRLEDLNFDLSLGLLLSRTVASCDALCLGE